MSKIVFCADLHFGYSGRLDDIAWACRVMNRYCEHNGIDTIINLGDLTHDRSSIGIDVYCTLYDILTEAQQKDIHWYTIIGNHDCFLKHSWEINSAKPLSGVITVIDDLKLLEIDGIRFWCLSFIHFEKSYMRVLDEIGKRAEPGDNLLTHIGVRGSTLNTCFMIKDWSFVHFENTPFDRIYTGHFHTYQQVGDKVWYPGSIIPFKHDEGDVPHGFLVYDTKTNTHEFVDIWTAGAKYLPIESPPPQYMTVLDEQLDGLVTHDVKGNIIRIALAHDYSHDEKAQIKSQLLKLGAKKVNWLQPKADKIKPGFNGGTPLSNPGELFTRWLEQDQPKDLDSKLLIKLENECRAEGDERYSYDDESD